MAGAAMPSTASFRPPTTISGTRWTRTTSTSTSRSTWPPRSVVPLDMVVELRSAVADRLDEGQKIQLANDVMHWSISNLLHGEQGALSLSASLCHILLDPGAQEYAANQAREEARHVAGFTRYIAKRWGAAAAGRQDHRHGAGRPRQHARGLQEDRRHADADRRAGDGLVRHAERADQRSGAAPAGPARDERRGLPSPLRPHLGSQDHPPSQRGGAQKVEDWSAQIFQTLLFNLINAEQKQVIYAKYGLDWQWVRDAVKESFSDDDRRA